MTTDIHWMLISIEVALIANDRIGDNTVLGEHITDDDRREGLRKYFAEVEDLDDATLETCLEELKAWEDRQRAALMCSDAFIQAAIAA